MITGGQPGETVITEHEMLITLATMALKMDDLTGHDVIEAFRALGHKRLLDEATEGGDINKTLSVVCASKNEKYALLMADLRLVFDRWYEDGVDVDDAAEIYLTFGVVMCIRYGWSIKKISEKTTEVHAKFMETAS